jgi:diguanylate cyclase (GGDEF)-like protein
MGGYSKFIVLGLMIIGMTIGMFSSLYSFQDVSQRITAHTTLSAWSLAQLELEYQKFSAELQLYRAGKSDGDKLSLAYDLAWNRMDVFLHGSESATVRSQFGADALIQKAFVMLQQHESLIESLPPPNSPELALWEQQLLTLQPEIRQLMIQNFTGPGARRGMDSIEATVKHISWVLVVVAMLSLLMSYLLFRESRQHWFLSLHDALTSLTNRSHFLALLKERCYQASVQRQSLSLCILDISQFTEVNDLWGHEKGDALLQGFGLILRQNFGKNALIGRTGGSEFALFIPHNEVTVLLPDVLKKLDSFLRNYDPAHRVYLCCGVSTYPEQCSTDSELFQFAEQALSAAKKNSPNHYQVFNTQMLIDFQRRRELATHLRSEILESDSDKLFMCYQPVHHVQHADKLSMEALLRWRHPIFGFIAPPEIIDIAEEHGLGDALGDWIFGRVFNDLSSLPFWQIERISVAVNLSESMFTMNLPSKLDQLIQRSAILHEQLILELTETIALHDFTTSQQILSALRKNQIRIALDDFGTGFSSLAYLKDLSVDKLKIDKSFIQQIDLDPRQLHLVRHITELAHDLGLTVVAEGVETAVELDIVTGIGAEEIQGYYYSRPLELPQLISYLSNYFHPNSTV